MKRDELRLFVAAPIDGTLRKRLEREIGFYQLAGADVHWTAPRNLHLSLAFLGDVDPADLPDVEEAIVEVTEEIGRSKPMVEGSIAIPDYENPKVVGVGLTEDTDGLIAANREIAHAMRKLGLRADKKRFVPHITLGRVRGDRNQEDLSKRLKSAADRKFGYLEIKRLVLYMSDIDQRGVTYTELQEFPLFA